MSTCDDFANKKVMEYKYTIINNCVFLLKKATKWVNFAYCFVYYMYYERIYMEYM